MHGISQIGLKAEPSFVSRSETFKFVAGETITLPCVVMDVGKCAQVAGKHTHNFLLQPKKFYFYLIDNFIVAWKRGIAILSAGSVKVTPDPRVRLNTKAGFSLQIRDAVPQDAGDYICQIATLDPMEIVHTVEILGESNFSLEPTQSI